MKIINSENAPKAVGSYSQGVEHNGIFYFSGMLGLNPITMQLADSFEGELKQILENIDAVLKDSNLTRRNIIKTTIFMTDLKNFPKVNEEYEKFFDRPFPARSCVQVSALPKNATIEIEVIAAK